MELISFLIAIGLGLILTGWSMKAQSYIFGLFGGIIILLTSLALLSGGLQQQMVQLTINETGNFTTEIVSQDLIDDTDILDTARFGIPILGLAIYIIYASAMSWNDARQERLQL